MKSEIHLHKDLPLSVVLKVLVLVLEHNLLTLKLGLILHHTILACYLVATPRGT